MWIRRAQTLESEITKLQAMKKAFEENFLYPVGAIVKLQKPYRNNRFMKIGEYLVEERTTRVEIEFIEWDRSPGMDSYPLRLDSYQYEDLELPTTEDVADLLCSPLANERALGEYLTKLTS